MVDAMRLCTVLLTVGLTTGCASWFRPSPPVYPVIERASGLVVQDLLIPDSGASVEMGDQVVLHYALSLLSGGRIESSEETGQPLRFQVGSGQVPAGLEEGVIGMRLFGRRRLRVPAQLGFGATGWPPRIPPEATLVFEVELLEHLAATH
jgi:FKBP-type peptidyl-prolyl cis-trans isomerase